MITPQEILAFWCAPGMEPRWFDATPELDAAIRQKYEAVWEAALRGELDAWQDTPAGALALVIVLDQFPRNMYRLDAKRYASAEKAVAVTKRAIEKGFDALLDRPCLAFLYMPLMHSEALADQDLSVRLFAAAGLEANLRYARHHRELVRRFGRFPHRNDLLGRESTAEEIAYLDSKEAFKA